MSDVPFLKRILLAVAGKATLFRQNVGTGWQGECYRPTVTTAVRVGPGDVVIRKARPLKAGLVVGSSDLIGWTPVTITPEMVGRKLAVFTAVEAKEGSGRLTTEQGNFIGQVRVAGGFAGEARNVDQALMILAGQ